MSDEQTSAEVGAIAARGLDNPGSLSAEEIRSVCASALTQRPDSQPDEDEQRPHPTPKPEERALCHRAAIVIRSLLADFGLADHIVRSQGEMPIVASELVTELEGV